MSVSKRSIAAVLCLVIFPAVFLYAEGTKQVMPNSGAKGQLCINKARSEFAFYDAPAAYRLNISIASISETIRFGFGQMVGTYTSDLKFRIKDSSGNIVLDNLKVPSSGAGFIRTYNESVAGPFPANAGYEYLEFQPLTTGDFYLEFFYPGPYNTNTRAVLAFFDITVVNEYGDPVNGRVWSKAWQFWSEIPNAPPTENRFYAKMMILSDDSIVTQIDCNGFIGGTFLISSNMSGCDNTGNLINDRRSRAGTLTYPQYRIFLNDPDNILFPTQKVTSGIIQPIKVKTSCTNGGADFGIKVIKDGTIRILIQVNPALTIDPEDIQIIANVKANPPDGTGINIIKWDGKDNYGNPVKNSTSLTFSVTNLSGMTHLPLYDIEHNDRGFIVKQIRPAGGLLQIYWDDSQIGGISNTTTGCSNSLGCHTWDYGDNNTINSWWFVSWSEISGIPFVTKRSPGILSVSGNQVHCEGTGTLEYSVAADPNSTTYNWAYSGTGVSIDKSGAKATLSFSASATEGTLSVNGNNAGCGDGPISSLDIRFESFPIVTLEPFDEICYTAPGFKLEGGQPGGGIYFVDGTEADSLFPYKEPEGLHSIAYLYTTPTGCANTDTTRILLRTGADCLGTVIFPNAFKPDNDSVNNVFRPVVRNINSFKMYVFNRWGALIFSTDDVSKGWDGTFNGKACPAGTYTFTSTYGLSLREDNTETKRGVFTLIR